MTAYEITVWWALVWGLLGYVLPFILWVKHRPMFPVVLFVVPAIVGVSWWAGQRWSPFVGNVGFTFYGALPAAVVSNVFILCLLRVPSLRTQPVISAIVVTLVSLIIGAGLGLFLPAATL